MTKLVKYIANVIADVIENDIESAEERVCGNDNTLAQAYEVVSDKVRAEIEATSEQREAESRERAEKAESHREYLNSLYAWDRF